MRQDGLQRQNGLQGWRAWPPIVVATPVLALVAGPDGLWAGGVGGVAWQPREREERADRDDRDAWQAREAGLPLSAVAALAVADGWLLAGGAEGIARSRDGGRTWQRAVVPGDIDPVAAIAISPRFSEDGVALAATLGGGILRSDDAGQNWQPVTFGLHEWEVTGLAWGADEAVLAATTDGIYRSPNAGRAWRPADGTEGASVAAVAFLPDGSALAALETGGLLRSPDGGGSWEADPGTEGIQGTVLLATSNGVLLGTAGDGVLRSADGAAPWEPPRGDTAGEILALAAGPSDLYAGTPDGLIMSADAGLSWRTVPPPPVHDLRQLRFAGGRLLVAGPHTGILRQRDGEGWEPLDQAPRPLSLLAATPSGPLFAAGPTGLARSLDQGASWEPVLPGEVGHVAHLSLRADGAGWAGAGDGTHLLRTRDGGAHWEPLPSPARNLPIAGVLATAGGLFVATHDPRQQTTQLWYSPDDGRTWRRGTQARIACPLVATLDQPPLLSLGGSVVPLAGPEAGTRRPVAPDTGGLRRLAAAGETLLALTTTGLYRSPDQGRTWALDDDVPPADQLLDMVATADEIVLLLTGGEVRSRRIA